jgi:hypothetical protein
MIADDVNNGDNPALLLCGNDYGTEVTNGRYDASARYNCWVIEMEPLRH